VLQAYPEVALRMSGALGPLQSEPVSGILTIAISDVEAGADGSARTKIVWEYNVGGKMRYPVPVISNAVDGVMTLQLTRLAELLGPVELPGAEEQAFDDEADTTGEAEDLTSEPSGPSVDEAFDDLSSGDTSDGVASDTSTETSADSGA